MGLYKRGDVWYSDVSVGGRRVRKPLHKDERIAKQKLRTLKEKAHLHRYGSVDPPWDAFKSKYLEYSQNTKSKNTWIKDINALKTLEKFSVPKRLSEIDAQFLDHWKATRKSQGKLASTINRELNAVKAMLRKAMSWGDIEKWDIDVKNLKETRGKLLFYSPKECRRLISKCHGQWLTIALLGIRAGLRRSEMHWLSWGDISNGTLSITPKPGWEPKDYEVRHIPMPFDLAVHMKGLKRINEWVLSERPDLGVMTTYFRRLIRKSKLKGSIHTLRHTYASHLAQAGVDLYTIAKLLGHSNVKVTQRYAHLMPKTFEAAVCKLPNI